MIEHSSFSLDSQEAGSEPAMFRAMSLPKEQPDLLAQLSLSPPYDNMGGINDTGSVGKSLADKDVTFAKSRASSDAESSRGPERYFHCLALDTVQFAIEAGEADEEEAKCASGLLREGREAAEALRERRDGRILRMAAHDGTALQVYPNGARPCYEVLLRDADGLEVRSCPSDRVENMPAFMVRFGAEWCLKRTYQELIKWAKEFVRYCGYEVEEVKLSRLEVRCDVPERFVRRDERRMRGTGTRNAEITMHTHGGQLSGLNNQKGDKPFKFNIYDKRLQVKQEHKEIWNHVWRFHDVDEETPIWRVEAKWSREGLTARGVDKAEDLTYRALTGLWSWFTRQYLILVSDPGKRTDRTKPTRRWQRVQRVTELAEPLPPIEKLESSPDRLVKQAEGCLASALARSGVGHDYQTTIEVLCSAMNGAVARMRRRRMISSPLYVPTGSGPPPVATG